VYAIVNIGGRQFKVLPEAVLRVPKLDAEIGGEITFDRVMLWSDEKTVEVGTPFVEGKSIQAEVIRHGKDKKVIVYKKKRRKKYRRKNGHRQQFTEIRLKGFAG
jgi:large subunit ribosomal protein L21